MELELTPMMDLPEIAALRTLLEERRPRRVLEWGAGGSTLFWPREFPDLEWVAVEHDPRYAGAVLARLPSNAEIHLRNFPEYWQLGPDFGLFDLIIVDGRERVRCLSAARELLAEGGVVLLHDSGRERYEPANRFYGHVRELRPPQPRRDPRGLRLFVEPLPRYAGEVAAQEGVVYLSWGEPAAREIGRSMESLWQHEPHMPVLVVGDETAAEAFAGMDRVTVHVCDVDPFESETLFGFLAGRVKPLLASLSPFERTLYVDAETTFKRSPREGFELLDRWDVVIAEAETRSLAQTFPANQAEAGKTAQWLGTPQILYHNSGMIFWRRNQATAALFEGWSAEWYRYRGWDEQIALLRALLKSQVLWLNVPFTWNCRGQRAAYFVYHRFASMLARKHHRPAGLVRPVRSVHAGEPLVRVELEPGRFVKVHIGDEDAVRAQFERQRAGRNGTMAVVKSSENWPVVNEASRRNKGPLVRVELEPGRYVKMYEADAIAQGYLKSKPAPEEKAKQKPQDKQRLPQQDKATEPVADPEPKAEAADFTSIEGVGKATARALVANGVTTFEALREAGELDYLTPQVNEAIQKWRESSGTD